MKILDKKRCAVIVVDKQKWYLDPKVSPFLVDSQDGKKAQCSLQYGDSGDYVKNIDRLVVAARQMGVCVVWTQMVEGAEESPDNIFALWKKEVGIPKLEVGDEGYDFCGLGPSPEEFRVPKVYPDSFSNPTLKEHLDLIGVDTVVIVGGYAARCVLATSFGAQNTGYHVVVPEDCVAPHPFHPQELDVSLEVVSSLVGEVLHSENIISAWKK